MAGKIGQPFVAITDGDMAVLKRLGRNAPRAIWLLTILRRQAGAKKLVEISDGRLAMLGKVSTSTVYYAIKDLIEMNFIRKASGDRAGRRKIKNAYQILPSPIVRDEVDGSLKIEDRFSEIEDQIPGNRGTNGQKPRNKRPKTEEPIIDNRGIDILDEEKKIDRGFCVEDEDGRMGGMVDVSGDSGLEVVEAFLSGMGLTRGVQKYARQIVDNGLTIEDMKVAAKIACYQVAKGNTEVSGYLGGIVGQKEWTPQLQQDALKYMRGVIGKCIRDKIPVKMSEQMKADMGDKSEWMNKIVVARE